MSMPIPGLLTMLLLVLLLVLVLALVALVAVCQCLRLPQSQLCRTCFELSNLFLQFGHLFVLQTHTFMQYLRPNQTRSTQARGRY
jgi:hypothetical protein